MSNARWPRRAVLHAAGVLAGSSLLSPAAHAALAMTAAAAESAVSGMAPGRVRLPRLLTDSHVHVYDDRHPRASDSDMAQPPNASIEQYRELAGRLGIRRSVIVQSHYYGVNNAAMLNALATLGQRARGVAVVDVGVTDEELQRFDALGVRGLRVRLRNAQDLAQVHIYAQLMESFDWHLEVGGSGLDFVSFADELHKLPVPVLLEHLGQVQPPVSGGENAALDVLLDLLARGNVWTHIGAPFLNSQSGPDYAAVGAMVRACVRAAPQRVIWCSAWPHASARERAPDYGAMLQLAASWVPAEARERVFADNAAVLYGF